MSGLFSSVGKVFKTVTKTVKKVLPIALAVGAIVFTAGAAMGALPSWGTAISQTLGKLGLDAGGVLAKTLTGAVTQAGYGAVLGGGMAALTGKDIGKGAMYGAAAGAVSGGVLGAAGASTDPLSGLNKADAGAAAAAAPIQAPGDVGIPSQTTGGAAASPAISESITGPSSAYDLGGAAETTARAPGMLAGSAAAPPAGGAAPGVLDKGGWLERNGTLAGNAIAGLGKGAMEAFGGNKDADALKARNDIYAANYRTTPGRGLLTGPNQVPPSTAQRQAPRFDDGPTWKLNRETGEIEKVEG